MPVSVCMVFWMCEKKETASGYFDIRYCWDQCPVYRYLWKVRGEWFERCENEIGMMIKWWLRNVWCLQLILLVVRILLLVVLSLLLIWECLACGTTWLNDDMSKWNSVCC